MKKFKIIYADPPWDYYKTKAMGNARGTRPYPTMKSGSISKLPIADICDDDSILFMWATWPCLFEAAEVLRGWGFEYKTCGFVWVKTYKKAEVNQARLFPEENFASFWGCGSWTRANTEFCLIGTRGKWPCPEDRGVHQIVYAPIASHSEKPAEVRNRIVRLCGDVPRVELFARQPAVGWERWGNEIECTIQISKGPPSKKTT